MDSPPGEYTGYLSSVFARIIHVLSSPKLSRLLHPAEVLDENALAQSLLVALADFIQPILHQRTPLPGVDKANITSTRVVEQRLVNCLKAFIASVYQLRVSQLAQSGSEADNQTSPTAPATPPSAEEIELGEEEEIIPLSTANGTHPNSTNGLRISTQSSISHPKHTPSVVSEESSGEESEDEILTRPQEPRLDPKTSYFLDKLSTSIQSYVSSKMPVRLLVFDSAGSNIRLVDQREVIRLLHDRLLAATDHPEFQATWQTAYLDPLRGASHSSRKLEHAATKGTEIIDQLVRKHGGYSILSHTWTKHASGEVTFQHWARRADNLRSNSKIANFCKVSATEHDLCFGWIDTVCINKESSAELDEAIRSMYKWYRNSTVCIVYLSETDRSISRDPWFKRGWTLQELVAPQHVVFYNKYWRNMHLGPPLQSIDIEASVRFVAGITEEEMAHFRCGKPEKIPISRRLDLAAGREVTREEDSAYSLMGLLDVSMSIAYGEGSKRAFSRLIRELLHTKKNILDIFNRRYNGKHASIIPDSVDLYAGCLTSFDIQSDTSTSDTKSSSDLISLLNGWTPTQPLLLTHVGLRMHLLLVPGLLFDTRNDSYEYLPVGFKSQNHNDLENPTLNRHSYSENIAQGHFFGHYYLYDLLHHDLYSPEGPDRSHSIATLAEMKIEDVPAILIFGVVNFGTDDDHILLPDDCLSVPLNCGTAKPGRIRPTDHITIYLPPTFSHEYSVPVFRLKSTRRRKRRIAEAALEHHGMQLMTLYL